MEATLKSKVRELFSKYHFSEEDAQFISEVLGEIDEKQEQRFLSSKELFLTQPDKVELIDRIVDVKAEIADVKAELKAEIADVKAELKADIADVKVELTNEIHAVEKRLLRTIYIVGLVQFLAIIASVLAIINFMLK